MSANEEVGDGTLLLDLPIMRAAVTALERAGLRTAGDIWAASSSDLVRVHGLGRKSYQRLHDVIGHDELPRRSHLQPRVAKRASRHEHPQHPRRTVSRNDTQ